MRPSRFKLSLEVAKQGLAVLRANPSLLLFPIMSGVATLLVSIPFLVVIVGAAIGDRAAHHAGHHVQQIFTAAHYVLMALMAFVNYFIVIFFNSALVACAHENLQGRPSSVQFGLQAAVRRLPTIITWAAISATVGTVLRFVSDRTGFVGSIVSSFIGLAWNIAVFFVVPTIVLEDKNAIQAIKDSTSMIKRTWGESLILGFGVSTVIALLAMVVVLPVGLAIYLLTENAFAPAGVLFFFSIAYILLLAIVGSALNTVHQTALYVYSRDGVHPLGFSRDTIEGAFTPKTKGLGLRSRSRL